MEQVKPRASLREINLQKQRQRALEADQYTGIAANMHRSPLRLHEEQKLKNDSPARDGSPYKMRQPPRDFSNHPTVASVMAPFLTP